MLLPSGVISIFNSCVLLHVQSLKKLRELMKKLMFIPFALMLLQFCISPNVAYSQNIIKKNLALGPFTVVSTTVSITCNGLSDGSVTINSVTGGTAPYTYLWSTGSTSNAITNLGVGTYALTITDSSLPNPNSFSTSFNINEPPLLSVNIDKITTTCSGGSVVTKCLTAVPTGGTSSYSYVWSRGDITQSINALVSNSYTVTCTDHNGCKATNGIFVTNGELDLTKPTFSNFPIDQTVNCNYNYTPLSQFGTPVVSDVCSSATLTVDSIFQLNSCSTGKIYRVFTATDLSGNTSQATQTITLNYVPIFNQSNISFPPNYTVFNCIDSTKLRPDSLPAPYNKPTFTAAACSNVFYSYVDLKIGNYPACYKILRKWTVMDMCQSMASGNPLDGLYSNEQIIVVMDTIRPVLTCPSNITVNTATTTKYVTLPTATATDCSNHIFFVNTYNSGKANASGTYPIGVTSVTIIANDSCNNTSTCTFSVTVKDTLRPVAVCKEGITINLNEMPAGILAMAPAYFYNNNSYDNITPNNKLKFTIRRVDDPNPPTDTITLTCDDHNAPASVIELELWVEDEAGNKDYCVQRTQVQDNNNLCPSTTSNNVSVSGTITNTKGDQIEDVMIYPLNSNLKTITTGTNGIFTFLTVPVGTNTMLKPQKNIDVNNGVSTLDMIILRKHILTIESLNSPYKYIAADVNKDNKLSTADLVELRKIILLQQTTFQNNESWRFINSSYQFTNSGNPLLEPFLEYYSINNIKTNNLKVDFKGIKIGDLDDSAKPNSIIGSDERTANGDLVFEIKDQWLKAGQTYRIAFLSKDFNNISGFQQTIKFDKNRLTINDVNQGILPDFGVAQNNLSNLNEGYILQSWDYDRNITLDNGYPLFTIEITAKEECELSKALYISTEHIRAEAYEYIDQFETNVYQTKINWIGSDKSSTSQSQFELFQNKPNPFSNETIIGYQVPEDNDILFQLLDHTGKLIYQAKKASMKGYNEINLTNELLKQSGVYTYKIISNGYTSSKKMMFLR